MAASVRLRRPSFNLCFLLLHVASPLEGFLLSHPFCNGRGKGGVPRLVRIEALRKATAGPSASLGTTGGGEGASFRGRLVGEGADFLGLRTQIGGLKIQSWEPRGVVRIGALRKATAGPSASLGTTAGGEGVGFPAQLVGRMLIPEVSWRGEGVGFSGLNPDLGG